MIGWNSADSLKNTRLPLIILTLIVLIQCVGLFDHCLWSPHEPRVAEIAREMSVTGNYLIPQFSLKPVLEYPFLYYATAGFFYDMFGTSIDGIGRIASLLFALGTLCTIFVGMRRLSNIRTASFAAIIVSTSWIFFETSHKMLVDNAVCFSITLALFAFLDAYVHKDSPGFKIFWVALILVFLAKGFFGLAIIAITITTFLVWQRDLKMIRRTWIAPGLLLLMTVICLWASLLYIEGGKTYLRIFFLNDQLFRFFWNPSEGFHLKEIGYYPLNFWLAAAPWSLLALPALFPGPQSHPLRRFCLAWFWGGIAVLFFISIKREFYLIHILPPMACLISMWLNKIIEEGPAKTEKIFLSVAGIQIIFIIFALPLIYFMKLRGPLSLTFVLFAASIAAAWFLLRVHSYGWIHSLVLFTALLYLIWAAPLYSQLDRSRSHKQTFVELGQMTADKPVIGFHLSDTVEALCPFYGGFYVEHIYSRAEFEDRIISGNPAYILLIPWRIDEKLSLLIRTYAGLAVPNDYRNPYELEVWELANSPLFPLPKIETSLPFHDILNKQAILKK